MSATCAATLGPRIRRLVVGGLVVLFVALTVPASALLARTFPVGENTFTTTTVQPPTVTGATADALLCTITLTWTAPSSGVAPDGYDLYRGTASGGPYTFVKHVGVVTTTTDTGLAANRTYYYVLQSTRHSWRSGNSNEGSAKTALLCV